ncbi:MAG: hypothetical protein EON60_07025 [Alphaproteobacteria bacterium]|nr:MAG: hypothetical protein EON60_07025 [Alphaproteobacteria bacterium]
MRNAISSAIATLVANYSPTRSARLNRSYQGYGSLSLNKCMLIGQIPAAQREALLTDIRFMEYEPSTGFYNPLKMEDMQHMTRLVHIHQDDKAVYLNRLDALKLGPAIY